MAAVGLLYVGAVLVVNGAMLLGWIDARSAAPLNLFVGALQVVTPTFLIFTAGGDADVVLSASGLYLFGFTYLFVAVNLLAGLNDSGLGYFSGFVAVCAVVYSGLSIGRLGDSAFGVLWLYWAWLWALFFLLLGLGIERLRRYVGAVAIFQGWTTGAIPAFLLLTGLWPRTGSALAVVLAVIGVVVHAVLYFLFARSGKRGGTRSARSGTSESAAESGIGRTGLSEYCGRRACLAACAG